MLNSIPIYPLHIVSGGQTGVDRAALDVAMELGWQHGGWCPLGRVAEDGYIPVRYRLRQTESPQYGIRTERNVIDSDATLILYRTELSGGTELTWRFTRIHGRPCYLQNILSRINSEQLCDWLHENGVTKLNVAGPRESTCPGIGDLARSLLQPLFLQAQLAPPEKKREQRLFLLAAESGNFGEQRESDGHINHNCENIAEASHERITH